MNANETKIVNWLNDIFAEYYITFLKNKLPGIKANESVSDIVRLLLSKEPDTLLIAKATITSGVYFHQHFTSSFCKHRPQKHKKTLMTWLYFSAFGIFI